MDFLTVKFLGPVAVVGIIAFMRWVNIKTSGKPFFPGVGDIGKDNGSGSGGGFPNLDLPHSKEGQPTDITPIMNSPNEVQQDPSTPIDDQTPVPTSPIVDEPRTGPTSPIPIFPIPLFPGTPSPTPVYQLPQTPIFTPTPYHPPSSPIQFTPISPAPPVNPPAPMYRSPGGSYAI